MKTESREKAILAQVIFGRQTRGEAEESLDELARLANTADADVVGRVTQRVQKPNPTFLVGEGKLEDIQAACRENDANLIIFDNHLTAAQVNSLDISLGIKVIDRTELILQIFARRANSSEAQIQVEIAQLSYMMPRTPRNIRQPRNRGGIGMRGPGESVLQMRRQWMRQRVRDLKSKLEAIRKRRATTRDHRQWPQVCVVGYTNAGKSTLLNALAHAHAYVDDQLFATLDTKTRRVHLAEGQEVLVSDTVGFIRNLPHNLVASFRSTLEEAIEADLLLIVADASHRHVQEHLDVVNETLAEIGAAHVPAVLLFNKCDAVESGDTVSALLEAKPEGFAISALRGHGLPELKQRIRQSLFG